MKPCPFSNSVSSQNSYFKRIPLISCSIAKTKYYSCGSTCLGEKIWMINFKLDNYLTKLSFIHEKDAF